jgi:hypothetical protein
MLKNGTTFNNFYFASPTLPITHAYSIGLAGAGTTYTVYDPFTMLDVYFTPDNDFETTDTYTIKIVYTISSSVSPKTGTYTWNSLLNSGNNFFGINTPAQSVSPTSYFTLPTAVSITSLSITKSLATNKITLNGDYVNANYLNCVYSASFSSSATTIIPLCFATGYNNYNIWWYISNTTTAGTALYIDLVNTSGSNLGTGYTGAVATLGSAYVNTAWGSTYATIVFLNGTNQGEYQCQILSPALSRKKWITATNTGSDGTHNDVPMVSSGVIASTSTAYSSLLFGVVSGTINGNINIYGWN